MKILFETDIGLKRNMNQDCCCAVAFDDDSVFAIVCDGMGGANAGEVASALAMNTVKERIKAGWRNGISDDSIRNLLLTSITAANINVYDYAQTHADCIGMGTTVVACVLHDGRCVIAHAGDSRAYLFHGSLRQITKDHSYVQTLVDRGTITEEEAKTHPHKNYITRALGVDEKIEIDFNALTVPEQASILLCSDGLTNFVSDKEITEILSEGSDDAAKQLISLANKNGGGDNITAVIISQK